MITQSPPVRSDLELPGLVLLATVGRVGQLGSDDVTVRRDVTHADVVDGSPEPDIAVVAPGLGPGVLTEHPPGLPGVPGKQGVVVGHALRRARGDVGGFAVEDGDSVGDCDGDGSGRCSAGPTSSGTLSPLSEPVLGDGSEPSRSRSTAPVTPVRSSRSSARRAAAARERRSRSGAVRRLLCRAPSRVGGARRRPDVGRSASRRHGAAGGSGSTSPVIASVPGGRCCSCSRRRAWAASAIDHRDAGSGSSIRPMG